MKPIKIYFIAALLVTATIVTSFKKPEPVKGFAVVELFTSEGCSSCPPADAVVARLEKESAGKPIYILAYHVDYWNHLGWKDAFSDAAYSARQRDYSRYLHAEVYTPQIVVNGKTEFVGSEDGTLHKAINSALQKESATKLTFFADRDRLNSVRLVYQVQGNGDKSVLLVAFVQKSAQTRVEAGENKGRSLSHVQIVRSLQTIKLSNNEEADKILPTPIGFNYREWDVIGLVQNAVTGEIMAACTYNSSMTAPKI